MKDTMPIRSAGWRKCLGNYEGLEEMLRPYEVVVLEN